MLFVQPKVYDFNSETLDLLFHRREYIGNNTNIQKEYNHINKLLNNKKLFNFTATMLGILMYSIPVIAEISTGVPWADKIGNLFLHYSNAVCMWVCIIKAMLTIIQSVSQDNMQGLWKKLIGYGVAAFACKLIPEIFTGIGK